MKTKRTSETTTRWCFTSLLVSSGMAACAATPLRMIDPTAENPLGVEIEVTRPSDDGLWLVTYRLSRPVRRLVFVRQTNQFREANWEVLSSDVRIARVEEEESLIPAGEARTFSMVRLGLRTFTKDLVKDYQFFERFTDGSVVMYTGHYNVRLPSVQSATAQSSATTNPPVATRFTFHGTFGDRLVLLGRVSPAEAVSWDDDTEDGTYVYFGQIQPIETQSLVAVIDPSLPAWLRDKTFDALPKLMDYYARRLDVPLTFRPTLYFSYAPDGGNGAHGGVLPQVLQFKVGGPKAREPSQEGLEHVFHFFAHEAAHFWNAQLRRAEDDTHWMHEGSAEALAFRAMLDFGIISRARYLEINSDSILGCAQGLLAGPLDQAANRREFRTYYDCGATIALVTSAAVRRASGDADLLSFWSELLDIAGRGDGSYTEADYFHLLAKSGASAEVLDGLKAILHQPLSVPSQSLLDLLRLAGIKTDATEDGLSKRSRLNLGRSVLQHLIRGDCEGATDIVVQDQFAEVRPMSSCRTFSVGMQVTGIGPYTIWDEGDRAYDYARKRCEGDGEVELTRRGEGQKAVVPCAPFADRGRAIALRATPDVRP